MKENKVAVQGKYGDKLLTLKEAAKYLRMGQSTLYDYVKKDKISCFPGGKILFNIDDLDVWLDKRKN